MVGCVWRDKRVWLAPKKNNAQKKQTLLKSFFQDTVARSAVYC